MLLTLVDVALKSNPTNKDSIKTSSFRAEVYHRTEWLHTEHQHEDTSLYRTHEVKCSSHSSFSLLTQPAVPSNRENDKPYLGLVESILFHSVIFGFY